MNNQGGSSEQLKALVDAIKSPIRGDKLPKLQELEGAVITIEVKNRRLNWTALRGHDMGCW